MVLGIAVAVVVFFGLFLVVLRKFLFICKPNEILVFSGRKHTLPDGTTSGFKILHGGRGFRMPFFEEVSAMDMRLFPVEVVVNNGSAQVLINLRLTLNLRITK